MASEISGVARARKVSLWRLLITPYQPQPALRTFLAKAETQENAQARVTVAIPDARECEQIFGVPLTRRGLQPVYLRIENRSHTALRLQLIDVDPNYYTPVEAAGVNHFSMLRRLSAFGLLGWWLFGPLLLILPFKLVTAYRANRRMDDCFRSLALHLCADRAGSLVRGFRLHDARPGHQSHSRHLAPDGGGRGRDHSVGERGYPSSPVAARAGNAGG